MPAAMQPVDLSARPSDLPAPSVWCVCYGPRLASRAYYEDHTRALLNAELRRGVIVPLAALEAWPAPTDPRLV